MSIDPKQMSVARMGPSAYRRGSWGTTAYRPLQQPDYTYQDVYDPTQAGGPYARPQTRQVGRFDYEDGRAVGSTDFYGNRFDNRGLPLGPEQARAVQQLQGPGGPQAPEYQYGGAQQYPGPSHRACRLLGAQRPRASVSARVATCRSRRSPERRRSATTRSCISSSSIKGYLKPKPSSGP